MQSESTSSELKQRLQKKTEAHRQSMEQMIASDLQHLSENWLQQSNDVLLETQNAIRAQAQALSEEIIQLFLHYQTQTGSLRKLLGIRAWAMPLIMSVSLLIGICGGGWGLMQWLSMQIESQFTQYQSLKSEVAMQKSTLNLIESKTGGVMLIERPNGVFLILPKNTTIETGWRMDTGQQAIRLGGLGLSRQ